MRNRDRDVAEGGGPRPAASSMEGPRAEASKSLFSAILTPHRSLKPAGFMILMSGVVAISFGAGMAFYMMGAWPVLGFFGLDAMLIYWAFKLNYRSGQLYETVDLTGDALTVTRILPSGEAKSWTFNPYWARCQLTELAGAGQQLCLISHGKRLVFGRFLSIAEKQDFADALSGALRDARGGSRI
jgi:uncharacterized membrane protein